MAQVKIVGKISTSKGWESQLYISRVDELGIAIPTVIDTVKIEENGSFQYEIRENHPEGILYKATLPPKGGNARSIRSGLANNQFFFSTEGNESLYIRANMDSLYYSLCVKSSGWVNNSLLTFRDLKRPFLKIAKSLNDSVEANPKLESHYKTIYMDSLVKFLTGFKEKVIQIADTTQSASLMLASLYHIHEANFGSLGQDLIKKYTQGLSDDILLVKDIQSASLQSNVGSFLNGVVIYDSLDNSEPLGKINDQELLILDIWASWCGPCRNTNRNEIPEFIGSSDMSGIKLVSVSIDTDKEKWKKAVAEDGIFWQSYLDKHLILKNLAKISSVPQYLVLDKQNKIIFHSPSFYLLKDFVENY